MERGTELHNFEESQDYLVNQLQHLGPVVCANSPESLEHSKRFFDLLGNPQEATPAIHIAGTSGKGSTTHYISGLLQEHGFKTGTLISPHVRDIRERAMIELRLMSEDMFTNITNELADATAQASELGIERPRFTEVMTGIGFLACKYTNADYAVVETVLGGRYDPTNTTNRTDKFSVITNLGLDHEHKLGNTVESIAWYKSGIFAPGGQATAFLPDSPTVKRVLDDEGSKKGCSITYIDPRAETSNIAIGEKGISFDIKNDAFDIKDITIPTIGTYQVKNASLALATVGKLAERDMFSLDEASIKNAFNNVRIPGRMEHGHIQGRDVIIDSATNPQKLQGLVEALQDANIDPPIWIFGTGKGKDHGALFSILKDYASGIVFAEYFQEAATYLQDRSAKAQDLRRVWEHESDVPCLGTFSDVNAAFDAVADHNPKRKIVIAGSIYMLGELADSQ